MRYELILTSRAQKDLDRFPDNIRSRLLSVIGALSDNPRPPGCLKMSNSAEWRVRVGDYRIRYMIDDFRQEVTITRVRHRKEAYDR